MGRFTYASPQRSGLPPVLLTSAQNFGVIIDRRLLTYWCAAGSVSGKSDRQLDGRDV
jgi:hypothetical protein